MYNLKQFKLASGDEIVCEVIEWAEDGFHEIIIKNAMEILHQFDRVENEYFYMFKPWIHFQESNTDISIIDSRHIVSVSKPNHVLLHQYKIAVSDMHINSELKSNKFKQEQLEKLEELSSAIDTISKHFAKDSDETDEEKQETSNVIKFPDKNDLVH